MKKDLEIWQFIVKRLKRNESVMLLFVAKSSGSSPGRQGFKMAVANDELRGSIGGGVMEVSLVEQAKGKRQKVKGKNKSEIVEQIHRANSPNSSGMICSGEQTVIFIELETENLETINEIIFAVENNIPRKLIIKNYQLSISEEISDIDDFVFERIGENEFIFEERLGFKNKLFIVGGGHCALALSELMSKMDFYISLFDDRPELNTLAKNEFAHEIHIIESYGRIGDYISSGANHYVVVMTLGYKFDETVIRELFDKDFKYFGVLGSKAKMNILLRDLLKEGFDKKRLDKIRTPIGLDINSRTPEEIAVSIAAEIIAVKNGKA